MKNEYNKLKDDFNGSDLEKNKKIALLMTENSKLEQIVREYEERCQKLKNTNISIEILNERNYYFAEYKKLKEAAEKRIKLERKKRKDLESNVRILISQLKIMYIESKYLIHNRDFTEKLDYFFEKLRDLSTVGSNKNAINQSLNNNNDKVNKQLYKTYTDDKNPVEYNQINKQLHKTYTNEINPIVDPTTQLKKSSKNNTNAEKANPYNINSNNNQPKLTISSNNSNNSSANISSKNGTKKINIQKNNNKILDESLEIYKGIPELNNVPESCLDINENELEMENMGGVDIM